MKLTVVIPTFNRNKTLLANLEPLLAQLTDEVELRILDNASDTPVSETLKDLLGRYPRADVEVMRHRANIGAAPNILRSFEVAKSPWVWIIGDDDLVTETAVADVLAAVAARPEIAFFNFATQAMRDLGHRRESFDTVGQRGFVTGFDYVGNVNFMSVSVWQVAKVLPYLSRAYFYAYSMSYPFVLLLSMLGNTEICHFSSLVLIRKITTGEDDGKWQFRDFILGWNTILELPMSDSTRHVMSRKMMTWHSPENVCAYLLADAAIRHKDSRDYLMVSRRLASHVNAFERLRFFVYRLFFVFPSVGWPIVRTAIKLAVATKIKGVNLSDIVGRASKPEADRR